MQKLLIILLISNFIFLDVGINFDKINSHETELKLIGSWSAMELISGGDDGTLRFIKRKKIKKRYSGINFQFKENKVLFWQITSTMCGASEFKNFREKPQNGIAKWEISKDSILEITYSTKSKNPHVQKYKLTKIDKTELLLEIIEF